MNRPKIRYIDHTGQNVAITFGANDQIPVYMKNEVKELVAEAVRNGQDLGQTIESMLVIAAQAMRHGIFPSMTKQIIGEPAGDQQCFSF